MAITEPLNERPGRQVGLVVSISKLNGVWRSWLARLLWEQEARGFESLHPDYMLLSSNWNRTPALQAGRCGFDSRRQYNENILVTWIKLRASVRSGAEARMSCGLANQKSTETNPLRVTRFGSVVKWSNTVVCKIAPIRFGGSNPPRPTKNTSMPKLESGLVLETSALRALWVRIPLEVQNI